MGEPASDAAAGSKPPPLILVENLPSSRPEPTARATAREVIRHFDMRVRFLIVFQAPLTVDRFWRTWEQLDTKEPLRCPRLRTGV